jgi:hypothetical protein
VIYIDYRQNSELSPVGKLIGDKGQTPHVIQLFGLRLLPAMADTFLGQLHLPPALTDQ